MKIRRINIEPNDDGTYQVECEACKDNGQWYDGGELKYSAKSIDDIVTKIKEAEKKISGMQEKKGKRIPDRSVEKYIET